MGANSDVIDFGVVLAIFEAEGSDAQLKKVEVKGSLLDSFVELLVIWEVTFNVAILRDQASELAVKGHKMGRLDV